MDNKFLVRYAEGHVRQMTKVVHAEGCRVFFCPRGQWFERINEREDVPVEQVGPAARLNALCFAKGTVFQIGSDHLHECRESKIYMSARGMIMRVFPVYEIADL